LAPIAESVTVVDSSPEAIAIARGKVRGNVTWVIDDIFRHRPDRRYDTVLFGFWLSHVPLERFDEFWALVDACLVPGGQVVFIDNAHPMRGRDVLPEFRLPDDDAVTAIKGIDSVTDVATGISTRVAADGNTYDLVKIWWEPDELRARLRTLGWDVEIAATEWAFIYGHGSRALEGPSPSE
jgi:SAM-dependent methyltransferase